MTVESSVSKVTYVADGSSVSFGVPFYFFDKQIAVYKGHDQTALTEGVDYTLTGAGNNNGGEVIFTTAPAQGDIITIIRHVDMTQLIKFMEGEAFPASDYEYSLDKIVMALQQLRDRLEECVTIPRGLSLTAEETAQLLVIINDNMQTIEQIPQIMSGLSAINNRFNDYYNKTEVDSRISQSSMLRYSDVIVHVSTAVADNTYQEYPYRIDVPLSGARASHIPAVCFKLPEALSGNFAPIAHAYDYGVKIFLKEVPEQDFSLASVIMH